MANDPPAISELRRQLTHQSLSRLSKFEPPSQPDGFSASPCSIALDILKQWSSDNKLHIEKAVNSQAFGNNKEAIDWSIAFSITFLSFMESMAVYLLNICDLVTESPEGHPDWDGPFCGAFLPNDKDTDKSFIGVAFKGTNTLQSREVQVHLNYQLIEASEELGNQLVSTGVYTGLFGKFPDPYGQPYQFIRTQLAGVTSFFTKSNTPARLHVTGHSLGGSYSSLCYAGFLKDIPTLFPETEAIMGDQRPEAIPSEINGPEPPIYYIGSIGDFIKAVLQGKSHLPNS
ncbi:lipase class 3 [Fusarium agapanthi]|uniref:Lipase class 3 n=1 Tax=Fusarium agapanthi TaxID=1803897 RepID=A0A9P5AWZ2_9HYPO|nr:lipase class 3 [Fusarium agapanthi]